MSGMNPDSIKPCYFIFGDIFFPADYFSNKGQYLVEFFGIIAKSIELNFDGLHIPTKLQGISEIIDKVDFHLALPFLMSLFEVAVT